jgi:hypothetical protein
MQIKKEFSNFKNSILKSLTLKIHATQNIIFFENFFCESSGNNLNLLLYKSNKTIFKLLHTYMFYIPFGHGIWVRSVAFDYSKFSKIN